MTSGGGNLSKPLLAVNDLDLEVNRGGRGGPDVLPSPGALSNSGAESLLSNSQSQVGLSFTGVSRDRVNQAKSAFDARDVEQSRAAHQR